MSLHKQKIYQGKELEILKSADSTKSNVERSGKRNHSSIQFDEEELDVEVPICYQKSRLSKQPKVENVWTEECFYSCGLEFDCSVKPEHGSTLVCVNQDSSVVEMQRTPIKCEDFLYNRGDICDLLNNIKTEFLETKSCIIQNAACSATFSHPNMDLSCKSSSHLLGWVDPGELECGKSAASSKNMEGLPESVDEEGQLEMKESASFSDEFLPCSLNEASTQYFDDMEESTSPIVNFCGESSDELSDNDDDEEIESRGSTYFTEETLFCSLNEASSEFIEEMEGSTYFTEVGLPSESADGFPDVRELETEESYPINNESMPCLNEASTHCSEMGMSNFCQEIAKSHCSHSPFTSKTAEEDVLTPKLSIDSSEEISAFYTPGSEKDGNSICSSSQEILCRMHTNPATQVSNTAVDDSLQSMEPDDSSYGSSGLESEELGDSADKIIPVCEVPSDGGMEDTRSDRENNSNGGANGHYNSSQDSQRGFTASNTSSFDDNAPLTIGMLTSSVIAEATASVDEAAKSSSGTCPPTGTEGLTAMESFDNLHNEKIEKSPERLLSTRKAFSPSSQENPCRTMADKELYESIQISNHRRQLWYENRTDASMTRAALKKAELMMGHDRIIKKLKNSGNASLSSVAENVFMSSQISCMESCTCTLCSSNLANAQKAIRFSLHQMHDMECFVMKLKDELKSMKYYLEKNLRSQLYRSADSPSSDIISKIEMRKASLNAVRLEESTRKWHSVLRKDWKRFCKIMTLSDNVSTKLSICQRQRKKVTFADEVGGVLCNFKVVENIPASVRST